MPRDANMSELWVPERRHEMSSTEADLEAAIHQAIRQAFPLLKSEDIHHQRTFKIQLGRRSTALDGPADWAATGRADIVISYQGQHLAVLELKKPDLPLSRADENQVRSYAKLLEPLAPISVLSNGRETRILETLTGKPLSPASLSEAQFSRTIEAVGKLSSDSSAGAIATLMGVDSRIWGPAFRATTADTLESLSGDWTA